MEHSYQVGTVVNTLKQLNEFFLVRTCIHKIAFARLTESSSSHLPSTMTALAQSPAIDVIGIGFASGDISIYDIRADEKIMRIFVREGPVRALAFRGGKGGSNICSFAKFYALQMDIQRLLLPRKLDIYPSGILARAGVCYIRYEVPTTAAYLRCNGSPASHC